MAAKRLTLLALAVLAGCGGEGGNTAAADSLTRDLQLLPADSSAPLNDRADASEPAPEPAPAPAPAPKPKPRPKPAAPAPAPAPAAPSPRTLTMGTAFETFIDAEISSKTNKAGESVTATVASDVTDAKGRVVIPAGSKVTLVIAEIHESENKSDKGKLTLTPTEVAIAGQSYDLQASAVALDRYLKDRPTNAGDVAKVGAGAAAGAVVGKVLGGGKGAVIGGVLGGAVGTQRAVQTQDRDVVVPANSRVEITLDGPLTR